ncbi:MAG: AarF/ABC1/UbiB kinase family protein [Myxococcales bacterium]|nr:AarF/ABC1/UbiB kinase family protein [Myxococcales bacterium]MCB9708565.1 AarF/ABC1/UbiB kinase family protein [Myxococcales bacterium]
MARYRLPRGRFIKAYWVTFLVILSYVRLNLRHRLRAMDSYDSMLAEVHAHNARRIKSAILELQGLFIKVGQLISIMTNFLPREFLAQLESLQDQVPARPVSQIRQQIKEELGQDPCDMFLSFDDVPLASASLGQVHRAVLKDGTQIVVKVQHQDIDHVVRSDLRTIWRILRIVGWFVPVKGLDVIYRQIKEMVLSELDFVSEANAMRVIAANLAEEKGVRIPSPLLEYSTRRALSTTFQKGQKLIDPEAALRWGHDRQELARRLVRIYCKMIFVDGFYHADPHPGNLLLTESGEIVLVDFGAVAQLSPHMKRGIPDFLEAILKRDTQGIFRALRTMGFIAHGSEAERASERIIDYFHRKFQDEVHLESLNLKDIRVDPQKSMENFFDLRRQNIGIRELTSAFQVPKDWVLLERTILLLAGVCTTLDPLMNPMVVIRPYLEEFVLGRHRDFTSLIVSATKDTALSALSVPEDLRRYLSKAMRGELEIQIRELPQSAQLLYAAAHQLIYAILCLGAVASAVALHLDGQLRLTRIAVGAAVFFIVLTAVSMFSARRFRRR